MFNVEMTVQFTHTCKVFDAYPKFIRKRKKRRPPFRFSPPRKTEKEKKKKKKRRKERERERISWRSAKGRREREREREIRDKREREKRERGAMNYHKMGTTVARRAKSSAAARVGVRAQARTGLNATSQRQTLGVNQNQNLVQNPTTKRVSEVFIRPRSARSAFGPNVQTKRDAERGMDAYVCSCLFLPIKVDPVAYTRECSYTCYLFEVESRVTDSLLFSFSLASY